VGKGHGREKRESTCKSKVEVLKNMPGAEKAQSSRLTGSSEKRRSLNMSQTIDQEILRSGGEGASP